MLVRTTTPNRLRWRTMATVTTASSVKSAMLMRDIYGCLPFGCIVGRARPMTAAVFGQHRPDAFMQAGLRERVRHDRAGEKEQRQKKQKFQRHQAEARLQAHAKDTESRRRACR